MGLSLQDSIWSQSSELYSRSYFLKCNWPYKDSHPKLWMPTVQSKGAAGVLTSSDGGKAVAAAATYLPWAAEWLPHPVLGNLGLNHVLRRLCSPRVHVHKCNCISGLQPREFRIVDPTLMMLPKKTQAAKQLFCLAPTLIY